jgi:hypothetical protein
MIELIAAVAGASISVAAMGAMGFSRRNDEARDAVIRLTAAVEHIATQLEVLHVDIKEDRRETFQRISGVEQHRAACLSGPAHPEAKKALELGWRRWWFELTLPAKLDQAETDWHATQPVEPEPIVTHHPIDDTLQTGDSRLLGGAMEIKAPWSN